MSSMPSRWSMVALVLLSPALQAQDEPLPLGARLRLGSENLRHCLAHSAAYSPDGKILATTGSEGGAEIRLWNAQTRRLLRILPLPDRKEGGMVWGLQFTGDGNTLYATGAGPGRYHVAAFDLDSGKRILRFEPEGGLSVFAISADGKVLATGRDKLMLWDAATQMKLHTLVGHQRTVPGRADESAPNEVYITSLAFSPDGKWLASAAMYDSSVRVFEVATGKQKYAWPGHHPSAGKVAFSPDGAYVATHRLTGPKAHSVITLWDLATGKAHKDYDVEAWSDFAFSPDGKWIAADTGQGQVRVWDRATGKQRFTHAGLDRGDQRSVVFSRDGNTLITCNSSSLEMWDLNMGRSLLADQGHTSMIRALDMSPDGKIIASGGSEGAVCLWDAQTGKLTRRLAMAGGVTSLVFSPDGRTLASSSWSSPDVILWDVISWKELVRIRATHEGRRAPGDWLCLSFSPNSQKLIASTHLGDSIFEVETGKLVGSKLNPAHDPKHAPQWPIRSSQLTIHREERVLVTVAPGGCTLLALDPKKKGK